eukprot:TRINITY_DN910_c0_g2_i7.p1 TRINITY_DN910_c0_g2~~TRINITY_DN910_c0_g2_i7.p1  ORF type:complete len:1409 (+),score=208.47 TRINITY_DN910_c0_g2_i7:89-4315(+)
MHQQPICDIDAAAQRILQNSKSEAAVVRFLSVPIISPDKYKKLVEYISNPQFRTQLTVCASMELTQDAIMSFANGKEISDARLFLSTCHLIIKARKPADFDTKVIQAIRSVSKSEYLPIPCGNVAMQQIILWVFNHHAIIRYFALRMLSTWIPTQHMNSWNWSQLLQPLKDFDFSAPMIAGNLVASMEHMLCLVPHTVNSTEVFNSIVLRWNSACKECAIIDDKYQQLKLELLLRACQGVTQTQHKAIFAEYFAWFPEIASISTTKEQTEKVENSFICFSDSLHGINYDKVDLILKYGYDTTCNLNKGPSKAKDIFEVRKVFTSTLRFILSIRPIEKQHKQCILVFFAQHIDWITELYLHLDHVDDELNIVLELLSMSLSSVIHDDLPSFFEELRSPTSAVSCALPHIDAVDKIITWALAKIIIPKPPSFIQRLHTYYAKTKMIDLGRIRIETLPVDDMALIQKHLDFQKRFIDNFASFLKTTFDYNNIYELLKHKDLAVAFLLLLSSPVYFDSTRPWPRYPIHKTRRHELICEILGLRHHHGYDEAFSNTFQFILQVRSMCQPSQIARFFTDWVEILESPDVEDLIVKDDEWASILEEFTSEDEMDDSTEVATAISCLRRSFHCLARKKEDAVFSQIGYAISGDLGHSDRMDDGDDSAASTNPSKERRDPLPRKEPDTNSVSNRENPADCMDQTSPAPVFDTLPLHPASPDLQAKEDWMTDGPSEVPESLKITLLPYTLAQGPADRRQTSATQKTKYNSIWTTIFQDCNTPSKLHLIAPMDTSLNQYSGKASYIRDMRDRINTHVIDAYIESIKQTLEGGKKLPVRCTMTNKTLTQLRILLHIGSIESLIAEDTSHIMVKHPDNHGLFLIASRTDDLFSYSVKQRSRSDSSPAYEKIEEWDVYPILGNSYKSHVFRELDFYKDMTFDSAFLGIGNPSQFGKVVETSQQFFDEMTSFPFAKVLGMPKSGKTTFAMRLVSYLLNKRLPKETQLLFLVPNEKYANAIASNLVSLCNSHSTNSQLQSHPQLIIMNPHVDGLSTAWKNYTLEHHVMQDTTHRLNQERLRDALRALSRTSAQTTEDQTDTIFGSQIHMHLKDDISSLRKDVHNFEKAMKSHKSELVSSILRNANLILAYPNAVDYYQYPIHIRPMVTIVDDAHLIPEFDLSPFISYSSNKLYVVGNHTNIQKIDPFRQAVSFASNRSIMHRSIAKPLNVFHLNTIYQGCPRIYTALQVYHSWVGPKTIFHPESLAGLTNASFSFLLLDVNSGIEELMKYAYDITQASAIKSKHASRRVCICPEIASERTKMYRNPQLDYISLEDPAQHPGDGCIFIRVDPYTELSSDIKRQVDFDVAESQIILGMMLQQRGNVVMMCDQNQLYQNAFWHHLAKMAREKGLRIQNRTSRLENLT